MGMFGKKEPVLCGICGKDVKTNGGINAGKIKVADGVICRPCYIASGIIRMLGNCQDLTTMQVKERIDEREKIASCIKDGSRIPDSIVDKHNKLRLRHKDGLPINKDIPMGIPILVEITLEKEDISLTAAPAFGDFAESQTFRIPYDRVHAMDVVSQETLVQKNKSIVGRSIAGGLLFGPAGAIVGGMTGIGGKTMSSNQMFFAISYTGKDGEIANLTFEIPHETDQIQETAIFSLCFNSNYNQNIAEIEKNEQGDIIL